VTKLDHTLDHNEVAQRAYAIALNGGSQQSDEENWLQAENEIRAEKAQQTPPKKSRARPAPASDEIVPEAD
jgi:Protein of unknown function (DUF2934)